MPAVALFVAALLHEDAAVLAAAVLASEQRLSIGTLYVVVYAGVLLNNGAIYALGAAAKRVPVLRRRLAGGKITQYRRRLSHRLFPTLALCRFVPGMLTPVLLGCGWFGISLTRFLAAAACAAAVYLALTLTLAIALGRVVHNSPWLSLSIAIAAVVAMWILLQFRRRFMRRE